MEENGTKVHYLSDGGLKAFVEASRPVHAKYEKTIGKDLLANAQKTAEKYIQ
jgi:TRAP-type C4-dicarboxylate transport system substrate-binding protein